MPPAERAVNDVENEPDDRSDRCLSDVVRAGENGEADAIEPYE